MDHHTAVQEIARCEILPDLAYRKLTEHSIVGQVVSGIEQSELVLHRYRVNFRVFLQQVKHAFCKAMKDKEVLLQARFVCIFGVKGLNVSHQASEELFVCDVRCCRVLRSVLEQVSDDLWVATFKHFFYHNFVEREVSSVALVGRGL